MRNFKYILPAVVGALLILSFSVQAAQNDSEITQLGDENKAAIMQKGSDNFGSIDQIGISSGGASTLGQNLAEIRQNNHNPLNMRNKGEILQSGFQNEALIEQSDGLIPVHNESEINQFGEANQAKTRQTSIRNKAKITQGSAGGLTDSDNRAFIDQDHIAGYDQAEINQLGVQNTAVILQKPSGVSGFDGGNNAAKIEQDGNFNEAFIHQVGKDNNTSGDPAEIDQGGASNKASILQSGNGSKHAKVQQGLVGGTGGNVASLWQVIDGGNPSAQHSAEIIQGKTTIAFTNFAVVWQQGGYAMHSAYVEQNVSFNQAKVGQTQSTINDVSSVVQSGVGHDAISIQGTQPNGNDAWKSLSPIAPNPMLPDFTMF